MGIFLECVCFDHHSRTKWNVTRSGLEHVWRSPKSRAAVLEMSCAKPLYFQCVFDCDQSDLFREEKGEDIQSNRLLFGSRAGLGQGSHSLLCFTW